MAKPFTTAVFEIGGGTYHACATLDTDEREWFAFFIKDGSYDKTIGTFKNIHDAWEKARSMVGAMDPSFPIQTNEGTDGTPFSKNDGTHIR